MPRTRLVVQGVLFQGSLDDTYKACGARCTVSRELG